MHNNKRFGKLEFSYHGIYYEVIKTICKYVKKASYVFLKQAIEDYVKYDSNLKILNSHFQHGRTNTPTEQNSKCWKKYWIFKVSTETAEHQ